MRSQPSHASTGRSSVKSANPVKIGTTVLASSPVIGDVTNDDHLVAMAVIYRKLCPDISSFIVEFEDTNAAASLWTRLGAIIGIH